MQLYAASSRLGVSPGHGAHKYVNVRAFSLNATETETQPERIYNIITVTGNRVVGRNRVNPYPPPRARRQKTRLYNISIVRSPGTRRRAVLINGAPVSPSYYFGWFNNIARCLNNCFTPIAFTRGRVVEIVPETVLRRAYYTSRVFPQPLFEPNAFTLVRFRPMPVIPAN